MVATLIVPALRFIYLWNETPTLNNYIDGIGGAGGLANAAAEAEVVAEGVGDVVRLHSVYDFLGEGEDANISL